MLQLIKRGSARPLQHIELNVYEIHVDNAAFIPL
jgi:hypothetical protein